MFHLTNPEPSHASTVYTWLRRIGYRFEELPFDDWRERLLLSEDFSTKALYPYMALLEDFHENSLQLPNYDCARTLQALEGSGIRCPAVDDGLLGTYVRFLTREGIVPGPEGR